MKHIQRAVATGTITTNDQDVIDALFLRRNPGWRPEDLGYPPRDAILIDLMRQIP